MLALLFESEHLTIETRKSNSAVDRDGIRCLRPEILRRSWKHGSYETEFMYTDKTAPIICMGWFRKGYLNRSYSINLKDIRTKEEPHTKFG